MKRDASHAADQQTANRKKSTVRTRGEHAFGAQADMDGHVIRTIGLERAKVKIGLLILTYNMRRQVQLTPIETRKLVRLGRTPRGYCARYGLKQGLSLLHG